jgi:hypothetical protein
MLSSEPFHLFVVPALKPPQFRRWTALWVPNVAYAFMLPQSGLTATGNIQVDNDIVQAPNGNNA